MNRFSSFFLALTTLILSTATAADSAAPNILWIMIDDCRADALGCYGEPWAKTPHMDRLARRGVRFETAIVQCMVCQPSRHSMLTGHYAHRVRHVGMGPPPELPATYLPETLPRENIDFPKALAALGMKALNVGKNHWGEWENVPFEKSPRTLSATDEGPIPLIQLTAPQKFPPRHGGGRRRWTIGGANVLPAKETRPAKITDAALHKLGDLCGTKRPFFLRVSYWAPHIPVTVPPEFMVDPESVQLPYPSDEELASKPYFERLQLQQYSGTTHLTREELQIARGTYYGLVTFVDYQVGRILEFLESRGELQNTLVVINSDHGFQLGEHGLHKKRNFYEQTVAVPLIFSWPGHVPEGKTIREPVEMVDFLPTVIDLVGLEAPKGISGRSLVPLMRGEVDRWKPAVFCEIDHAESYYTALRVYSGRRIMIRTSDWKMIYFRDERAPAKDGALYDMRNDPGETRNLYDQPAHAATVKRLEALVDSWDADRRE